jgi:hypothetical protein
MADQPVWTPGEKAAALGIVGGILTGVSMVVTSLLGSEIDKENREGSR